MDRLFVRWISASLVLLFALGCGAPATVVVTSTPSEQVTVVVTSAPGTEPTATQPSATQAAPTATAAPTQAAAGIEILEATFTHGLGENMEPSNPGDEFLPDETVYLSVQIKGRPKEGQVSARFYWNSTVIAEASVDLADVNSGVLFSVGENTYAGYTLTHDEPLYLGGGYGADVYYGDQLLGSWPFRVVPPADAIPTNVASVTLARGTDENYDPIEPTTTFASDEEVYLVGHGDLGLSTWLQADWYVDGKLDEAGTRSITLSQNAPDVGFSFSYLPEGGWPAGEQSVVLTVNGDKVGVYTFTITQ